MIKLPVVKEPDNTKEEVWQKPDLGWDKVNVDGSFLQESSSGAWGAVVQDHDGRIILSSWDYIPRCKEADFAEAILVYKDYRKRCWVRTYL